MQPSKRLGAFWALNLSLLPSVLASETCSQLSGSVYTGPNNNKFDILCDTSTVNGQIFAYYSQGDLFQDCVDRCDSDSNCVVALYLSGSGDCALISTYQGTRSFVGNDVAIKGAAETTTAASTEATSTEATTSEAATSSEAATTDATTSEATSTGATTTEAATTSEVATTETTSTEGTTSEAPTTSEAASTEATSTEAIASTGTTASTEATTSEAAATEIATTSETSSLSSVSISSTSETLTSAQSTTATTAATDSLSTTTASAETSTDDCDDETSTLETSTTVPTSTLTGSEVQPTTSSTDSQSSSSTTDQSSEVSTSAPSATSTISSPSSSVTTDSQASLSTSVPTSVTSQAGSLPVSSGSTVTQTYTQTYATNSQGASSSGSSSSGTTEVGSKTLSTSVVTTIKTTSGGHLPAPYPTAYNVWTVCLTVVEHVTCSTGVITETATTTTYVTVGSNGGSYGPPVITTPAGCIGGYQVDASGHSYPVAQTTKGTHGNSPGGKYSQPSVRPTPGSPAKSQSGYETIKVHIPTPAAKPHGSSQPGQGSSEHNGGKPQPTQGGATQTAISEYHPGVPVNLSPSSAIHQGQQGISTIFTTKASVTEEMQAPKSTHSGSSEAGEAPYTPVTISGANRLQYMIWTLAAGALLGFGMLL